MKIKKYVLIVLSLLMIIVFSGCNQKPVEDAPKSLDIEVREFNKHGNVILETTFDILKEYNIEPMDLIKITIGENNYIIPVGTAYSDVDSGSMICRFDTEDSKVILAVNGGNFAEKTNMAIKEKITEDPGYKWNVNVDKINVILDTKYGYKNEYVIRHLERTNERTDYSVLNDAEFANCRVINLTGIKDNMLYRGTTPLADDLGRNSYAMDFLKDNNIKSIINLTDTLDEIKAFETYNDSYYASCNIGSIVMDYNFTTSTFGEKVKECVEFINNNDGPYYIHCKEGKDRTGMLCAILECYLGASYEEVINDYMTTYINFYHVEKNSETYNIILKTNIENTLCAIFKVEDLSTINLQNVCKDYLLSTGLNATDLNNLKTKLAE